MASARQCWVEPVERVMANANLRCDRHTVRVTRRHCPIIRCSDCGTLQSASFANGVVPGFKEDIPVFISEAFAQAAPAASSGGAGFDPMQLVLFGGMFAVLYFVMIRPQM